MSERIYVVTLYNREDLESFYTEMAEKGFRVNLKRPLSRNTHYWMTDEQAAELKEDPRVWDVQLTPEDLGLEMVRHAYPEKINWSVQEGFEEFWKDDTVAPATIDPTMDRNWGLFHHSAVYNVGYPNRAKTQFGSGGTFEETSDNIKWYNDGTNVDVVICDDPVSSDAGEWVAKLSAGTSNPRNRLVDTFDPNTNTWGSNRFVEYQWFNNLNSAVSSIDDDGQTLPTGTVTYYTNATNPIEHGTHVAGTVAGAIHGWANAASIYGLQVLGTMPSGQSIPGLLIFDYLRAFHANKPVDDDLGFRRPTVTNHSWGYAINASNDFPSGIPLANLTQIEYQGVIYNSSNPGPSGWNWFGIETDFGIGKFKRKFPYRYAAIDADVEDAIADGIVIVVAAGNDNFHMVRDGDPNWNNNVIIQGAAGNQPIFFNQGSSPGSAPNAINVGSISKYSNFRRSSFSNYGPRIDVWAAGENILSAWPNPASLVDYAGVGISDPSYSPAGGPPWSSGSWIYPIQGTSMACPQVTGVLACYATGKNRFTQEDAFGILQRTMQMNLMDWDGAVGNGSINTTYDVTVTAPNSSVYTLVGDDRDGTINGNNEIVRLYLGDTINFNLSNVSSIHPFFVRNSSNNQNVTTPSIPNNGATGTTTVSWTPTVAGSYYYVCGVHGGMRGDIIVDNFTQPPAGQFSDDSCRKDSPNATLGQKELRWDGDQYDPNEGPLKGVADDFKGRRITDRNSLAFPRRNTLFQPAR
tara:strand:- start:51 stop:2291 length:2241 start_codon:yes stop_codon:yes gene_type:complete